MLYQLSYQPSSLNIVISLSSSVLQVKKLKYGKILKKMKFELSGPQNVGVSLHVKPLEVSH